jgi:hypothetical protein
MLFIIPWLNLHWFIGLNPYIYYTLKMKVLTMVVSIFLKNRAMIFENSIYILISSVGDLGYQ